MSHGPGYDDEGGDEQGARSGRGYDDPSSSGATDSASGASNAIGHADSPSMGAGGNLDPVFDEVQPEVVKAVRLLREFDPVWRSWSGPLPPASELQAFDDVVAGAAERILRMSEKALDSQIDVDKTLAHGDRESVKRGQWQTTAVVSLSLICALVVALIGAPWAVVAVFVAPPVFEFGTSMVRAIREPRRDGDREDK